MEGSDRLWLAVAAAIARKPSTYARGKVIHGLLERCNAPLKALARVRSAIRRRCLTIKVTLDRFRHPALKRDSTPSRVGLRPAPEHGAQADVHHLLIDHLSPVPLRRANI